MDRDKVIKDTNPDHYKVDDANFIEYMNDPKISGFGNWMFANGFNSGVWASSNWISVKDRMPDAAGYECLVCAVNENYNQTHVFTAHTGYGEPGWWTGNVHYMSRTTSPRDNRLHPALNVTHWMPLPEPPKEES